MKTIKTEVKANHQFTLSKLNEPVQTITDSMDNYKIINELGKGAHGIVYKALNLKTNEIVVLKQIEKHKLSKKASKINQEVFLLSKLKHPYIIRYLSSFENDTSMNIIMEFAEKGDIHSYLKSIKAKNKRLEESLIWKFIEQLFSGLSFMHEHHIIHRDIKTLNLFLDKNNDIKIGDFGVSKLVNIDNDELKNIATRIGTPLYISPELVQNKIYDYKVDIWAAGCVLYYMCFFTAPFSAENIISLGYRIVHANPKMPKGYSFELEQLILNCLQKDPVKRLTANQVLQKCADRKKNILLNAENASFFKFNDFSFKGQNLDNNSIFLKKSDVQNQNSKLIFEENKLLLNEKRKESEIIQLKKSLIENFDDKKEKSVKNMIFTAVVSKNTVDDRLNEQKEGHLNQFCSQPIKNMKNDYSNKSKETLIENKSTIEPKSEKILEKIHFDNKNSSKTKNTILDKKSEIMNLEQEAKIIKHPERACQRPLSANASKLMSRIEMTEQNLIRKRKIIPVISDESVFKKSSDRQNVFAKLIISEPIEQSFLKKHDGDFYYKSTKDLENAPKSNIENDKINNNQKSINLFSFYFDDPYGKIDTSPVYCPLIQTRPQTTIGGSHHLNQYKNKYTKNNLARPFSALDQISSLDLNKFKFQAKSYCV